MLFVTLGGTTGEYIRDQISGCDVSPVKFCYMYGPKSIVFMAHLEQLRQQRNIMCFSQSLGRDQLWESQTGAPGLNLAQSSFNQQSKYWKKVNLSIFRQAMYSQLWHCLHYSTFPDMVPVLSLKAFEFVTLDQKHC